MKKVPFTQAGVDLKRVELEALSEEQFRIQINEIRYRFRDWATNNFQLNDDQLAYLRETPDEFINFQGISVAIAFDYKLDLQLTTPDTYSPPIASRRKAKVVVKASGSWSPGESVKIEKWYVGVGYNIPIFN